VVVWTGSLWGFRMTVTMLLCAVWTFFIYALDVGCSRVGIS